MEKTRILVIDDEESLCEILQFNLEVEGFLVDVAYNAEEAPKKEPHPIFSYPSRCHDGRNERVQVGTTTQTSARNCTYTHHILHGQRLGRRYRHRSRYRRRRLHHQAFLDTRSHCQGKKRTAPFEPEVEKTKAKIASAFKGSN